MLRKSHESRRTTRAATIGALVAVAGLLAGCTSGDTKVDRKAEFAPLATTTRSDAPLAWNSNPNATPPAPVLGTSATEETPNPFYDGRDVSTFSSPAASDLESQRRELGGPKHVPSLG